MNDTKRTRRVLQPGVDSLEGRSLLSAVAGVMAPAAHVAQHQVQEQRQLRLQEQHHAQHSQGVEIRSEMQTQRQAPRTAHHATAFPAVSLTSPGAMSITVGTPAPTAPSASSSSGSTPAGPGLQIHTLAPNNLGATNAALQGMSDGMATEETVMSTGRTSGGGTSSSSTGSSSGSSMSTTPGMMMTTSTSGPSVASVTNLATGSMNMDTTNMMM